ncbi:MAG: agmatinase family protein [Bacteroidetes bacterium]|nr:agmatinase family protein [Bacteroidota bacterium]MBU1717656.1 agmatinase family protein [Bacteroidota bacterium]
MSDSFDPNAPGMEGANIFGYPTSPETADFILIPVPWDVTVSYGEGASDGPDAIFEASKQTDVFDPLVAKPWTLNVAIENLDEEVRASNYRLRELALEYIEAFCKDEAGGSTMRDIIEDINAGCLDLNAWLYSKADLMLHDGKLVGVLGGEHSCSLGLIEALADRFPGFGILQIDAHADLRDAYEGFHYSHASAMQNALMIKGVQKLVQVGIRDFCQEEVDFINNNPERVATFFDRDIHTQLFNGEIWANIVDAIIAELPQEVFISFDIDGLDPSLCPNTGTPVPGGLSYNQTIFLLERIALSGKRIIGFDLCEVAPGESEWDGFVAAKILFRLVNLTAMTNGKLAKI